ncbi:MAG: MotA/TolQ/ExbB proton channel family protein [Planctomycetaceae bacterium]|nr:MotA/TolQ/ExbB proton channel family protein [Planctomycetaceae bacterium]
MSSANPFYRAGLFLLAALLLFSSYSSFAAVDGLGAIDDTAPQAQVEIPAANPAQDTSDSQDPPVLQKPNYLVWMVESLGWFFTPVFLVMSITMVTLFVINLLAIRRSTLHPDFFVAEFSKLLDDKKYQEAFEVAKENDSLLAKILAAGLSKAQRGYDPMVQAMQEIGEIEILKLENRLKILAMLGNIAPMLGLFGTVVGMIDSFSTIAVSITTPPAYKLAEGVATALFTTEVGLAIAIPSIAFYEVMKNILSQFTLEVSITSDNLMNRFKK